MGLQPLPQESCTWDFSLTNSSCNYNVCDNVFLKKEQYNTDLKKLQEKIIRYLIIIITFLFCALCTAVGIDLKFNKSEQIAAIELNKNIKSLLEGLKNVDSINSNSSK